MQIIFNCQTQTKNMKSKTDQDSDLENVLDYKLKIDFSKLTAILKECRSSARENTDDICALRTATQLIREDKESMQSRLQECLTGVDQIALSMTKYNEKLIQLEGMLMKNLSEANEKANAQQSELQKTIEEKLATSVKGVEEKLAVVLEKLEKAEAKEGVVKSQKQDKTAGEIELEEKMGKLETSLVKEIDLLRYFICKFNVRSTMDTKLYELEGKVDSIKIKAEEKSAIKGNNDQPTTNLAKNLEIESIAEKVVMREERNEAQEKLYAQRFAEIEETCKKLEVETVELNKKYSGFVTALKGIQKTFSDKLKIKVVLEGVDDDSQDRAKVPSFSKEPPKNVREGTKAIAPTTTVIQKADPSLDLSGIEKQINILAREVIKCAPKDSMESLDQALKMLQAVVATKCNRKDFETFEQTVASFISSVETKLAESQETQIYQGNCIKENIEAIAKLRQDFDGHSETIKKTLDLFTNLKFRVDDVVVKLEQSASSSDVTILKQTMNEYFYHLLLIACLIKLISCANCQKISMSLQPPFLTLRISTTSSWCYSELTNALKIWKRKQRTFKNLPLRKRPRTQLFQWKHQQNPQFQEKRQKNFRHAQKVQQEQKRSSPSMNQQQMT
eukprot:TRINITY_DN423_c0_g1_i1.p2 TRINITY_DN423_c0_g1~~TRINITY_DN423_c0_g1_i1.p2  ORF type:complete len:618 (+),score=84.01 TRINITY_DN423_c0_g1_i1:65-1918(+)